MALYISALHLASFVGTPAGPSSGLATAIRSSAPAMAITSMSERAQNGGMTWNAARGLYMMPDEPEIDPRRKEPAERPPSGPRPFMPIPMVGAGDDKMDVLSRLLRDRILLMGQGVRAIRPMAGNDLPLIATARRCTPPAAYTPLRYDQSCLSVNAFPDSRSSDGPRWRAPHPHKYRTSPSQ